MKPYSSSRRAFLKHGVATLSAGGIANLPIRRVHAEPPQDETSSSRRRQAVACSQRDAGEAARSVLAQGGNAVDAAVAALLVQCVIEPWNVGLGGYGGSMVVYQAATNRAHAIEFTMRAPQQFDLNSFNKATANHGYLAVGVPGVVSGIELALRKYGSLPFKTLAAPALALAEQGITVTGQMATSFKKLQGMDEASRRAFFPEGVPNVREIWKQPDLAGLMQRLADEGLANFYRGDIASTISQQVQAEGGVLCEDDFADFQAVEVEPLKIQYRGCTIYSPPPPSAGLTVFSILKTLEQFDLSNAQFADARFLELVADATNLCWQERAQYLGDPDFVRIPMNELLSEERAASRAKIIRTSVPLGTPPAKGPSDTVNIVVADKDHNVVSWTATHGNAFGAQVAIEGLGLVLGHGMSRFAFDRNHPNFPAAGKRPQHNMAPMVILQEDKPYVGLGMVGGTRIVTVTAQVAANLIDFATPPEEAVNAPRFHTEGAPSIQVTSEMPARVVDELRQRGRRVTIADSLGGGVNVVRIDPESSEPTAAASQGSTGALAF